MTTEAAEIMRLRNDLHTRLTHDELRAIGWQTVANAAAIAIAKGWTGAELAAWCDAELAGNPPDNVGAVVVTTLQRLAQTEPPRDVTPVAPPFSALQAERAHALANSAHVDHSAWVAQIRQQVSQVQR